MYYRRKLRKFRSLVLLGLCLLVACVSLPATDGDTPDATDVVRPEEPTEAIEPIIVTSSDPSTPIIVKLILSKAAKLEEPVELTLEFFSVLDAPGTTAAILLPEGAVLMDGKLDWAGDLAANEPHQLQSTIKFVEEGNWTIEAIARRELENGDVWGDAAYIYLHVTETFGQVGFPTLPPSDVGGQEDATPPPVDPQS